MPIGLSSLFNKTGVLGKIFRGSARSEIARGLKNIGVGRTMRGAAYSVGAAWDSSIWLSNRFMRGGARTIGFAGRHPVAATTIGMGLVTATGITRGILGSSMALRPTPMPNKPASPGGGPGYSSWARSGMSPIGASGDLTLALRKVRHH